MTPLAVMEAIATVLWVYAGLALLEWGIRVARTDRRQHIGCVTDLLGNLVPAMITLVVIVMAGAVIGLPSVVVIIAVLFPAGLAFGAHMSLNDLREVADLRVELGRLAVTAALAAGVIYVRQVA
ncbi:MAG: hypothetical protein AAF376_04255 [Pseudomonadota bacterium]